MDDRRITIAELREQQRQNWPEAYRDSQPAVLRLLRAHDLFRRESADILCRMGLQIAEFDVLAALRRQAPPHCVSPTQLCSALLISSGGLTKVLKRLEAAGWVARPANPDDGRSQLVELTDSGREKAEQTMALLCDLHRDWLSPLNDDELRQFDGILAKLLAAKP